jgi:hypothetical protein
LMKSAACVPLDSMLAYDVDKSGSLRKPTCVTAMPAAAYSWRFLTR